MSQTLPAPHRVTGVMVCFYPAYRARALEEFQRILLALDPSYQLVVVTTGPEPEPAPLEGALEWHHPGNEFQAWDYARGRLAGTAVDLLVFANDTFCVHRPWNALIRSCFLRTFRRLLEAPDEPRAAGRADTFFVPYQILGQRSDKWISSFLFAFSKAAVAAYVAPFWLPEEERSLLFVKVGAQGIEWGPQLSPEVRAPLERWLFPLPGKGGWYRARQADATVLAQKLECILSEHVLSARLRSFGIRVDEVWIPNILRRLSARVDFVRRGWTREIAHPAMPGK